MHAFISLHLTPIYVSGNRKLLHKYRAFSNGSRGKTVPNAAITKFGNESSIVDLKQNYTWNNSSKFDADNSTGIADLINILPGWDIPVDIAHKMQINVSSLDVNVSKEFMDDFNTSFIFRRLPRVRRQEIAVMLIGPEAWIITASKMVGMLAGQ